MSDMKTITLPDADDMLQRLKSVSDTPYLVERFYPHILKHAGEKKYSVGVVLLLQLAIADYTEGLPPALGMPLQAEVPRYLEVLIDDEAVRNEALEIHNEASQA